MSPRPYRMTQRAQSVEQTRGRILRAALAEYAIHGIDGTSMQAVARRADVASGTVLYHFPTPEELADAVIADSAERMALPTAESIDDSAPLSERIRTLTEELFRVYAGTDAEFHMWTKSREHPALRTWELWYYETYGKALSVALGEHAAHPRALQIASALIDPGFRASLLQRGLDEQEAVDETVRLGLAWLDSDTT